jgi:cell division protease FtsH
VIIPRGQALGVTFSSPTSDRFNYDETYLCARIKLGLGGRAAQELVYGEATEIARQMVGRWGMSDAVGTVAVLPHDGQSQFAVTADAPSERTRQLVDAEVRRIVETATKRWRPCSPTTVISLMRSRRR